MIDPRCSLCWEGPNRFGVLNEIVSRNRVQPALLSLLFAARELVVALGKHEQVLVNVAQTRVGSGLERAPSARRPSTGGFVPNDFSAHQKTDFVHDDVDVRRKRNVGLATQIGHVNDHASTRGQHPVTFGKDLVKQRQVFLQREVLVVVL